MDDFFGGILLLIAAGLQCLTIYEAFRAKQVTGVHPASMIFFMSLNAYYVWFFGIRFEWWSMVGEFALVVTYSTWISQYYYYKNKNKTK